MIERICVCLCVFVRVCVCLCAIINLSLANWRPIQMKLMSLRSPQPFTHLFNLLTDISCDLPDEFVAIFLEMENISRKVFSHLDEQPKDMTPDDEKLCWYVFTRC